MTRQELRDIFIKYLEREPSKSDYIGHLHKHLRDFEKEISECKEYLNLQQSQIKSMKNLKIAVLLSGHIRKNSILEGLNKLDNCDVFIHTWDNIGLKGTETDLNSKSEKDLVDKEIGKFKNLKKFVVENNRNWIVSQGRDTNTYFNLSSPEIFIKSQLYSINQSFQIMDEYSIENNIEYDIVFKFRFDVNLNKFDLTVKTINDIKNNDIIFVPNHDCKHGHLDYATSCWACDNLYHKFDRTIVHIFEHTNVICDLFSYGSKDSMKQYCNLYHNYDELNQSFLEENLKQYEKIGGHIRIKNGNYYFHGHKGHIESLYYYNCSYPERLLQKFLRDYMLVESKDVKLSLER